MGVAGEGTQAWHSLGGCSTTELHAAPPCSSKPRSLPRGESRLPHSPWWQVQQSQRKVFCLSDSGHFHRTLGSVFLSIYKWHLKQRVPWSETGQIGPGHCPCSPASESPGAGSCEAKEKASRATGMPGTPGAWVSGLDTGSPARRYSSALLPARPRLRLPGALQAGRSS